MKLGNCDCEWRENSGGTGDVKGYTLVGECDPCIDKRRAANAAYAIEHKYDKFNYTLLEGRMIQVLPQERWFQLSMLGIHYTMQRLCEYPDKRINCFNRFNAYLAGLGAGETPILTPDEIAQIKALFLEQGVDLDNL